MKKITLFAGICLGLLATACGKKALDGLPAEKVHCSVLAEEAIHSAIEDYKKRSGEAELKKMEIYLDTKYWKGV